MQVTQKEEFQGRAGGNMSTGGRFAINNHKNGGKNVKVRRSLKRRNLVLAATAAIMFVSAAAFAQEGRLLRAGNGPGPAANGPGPGCNIIPPLASIGTKVDISQFPPADSLTNPDLAGPVQLLKSGKFDIPTPRGTITLPLFKGAVNTRLGLKPVWYIILDAGDQARSRASWRELLQETA